MSTTPVSDPTELRVLLGYLNRVRDAMVAATVGLDDAQLRVSTVPTGTNLLGLTHHLAGVEQHWAQFVFLGNDIEVDKSMIAPAASSRHDIVETYRHACNRTDEIAREAPNLSAPAFRPNPGEDQRDSLRVILTHLLEETARHAGHADIIREQIDGVTAD